MFPPYNVFLVVFLVEDDTGSTEWPGDDGRFELSSVFYVGYMRVSGHPRNQINAAMAMTMPQLESRYSGFFILIQVYCFKLT